MSYDTFAWRIYKSPHFEVYYYPEFEQHLARVVSYAESAYQKVSSDLKHEISSPIPLILYKTHSEFEQTNLFPAILPEGVLAFAEPTRGRMVLPIDLSPDELQGLITHELTHVFEFDLIPRNMVQRSVPLWVDEGLADYMRGTWDPIDLMSVRDAAVTEQIPRISRFEEYGGFANPRLVYNLGHAAFEFIEARFGKEGIRQFLYTFRKNIVGGGMDEIYQQAFRMKPEEFDEAFEKWLKERFKPFRDKQRPSEYGRDLSPNPEKTSFTQVFAFAASPSGEIIAAITGNRSEGEADIILLSARDGNVIKNLTKGFTGEYEGLAMNESFVAGRSIDFSPSGDTVAFFARKGKKRSLYLASVLTGEIVRRIPLELDQAQAPCLLPDGQGALLAALKEGVSDIYHVDLRSGAVKNLTQDAFYDTDPQVSPDGKTVTYTRRITGHDKVYVFPLANPAQKTQITFGAYDDNAPVFSMDGNVDLLLVHRGRRHLQPPQHRPEDGDHPPVHRRPGRQHRPEPLFSKGASRVGFISYFKGEFKLHSIEIADPVKEVEQEVQVAADEPIDFQPDVTHQVVAENKRRKKVFEKLYLEGRPPINLGVTSSGDFFGGTQVALADVLGDKNFLFTAISQREFRSYEGAYIDLGRRLHWGATAFDSTQYFYASPYDLQTELLPRGRLCHPARPRRGGHRAVSPRQVPSHRRAGRRRPDQRRLRQRLCRAGGAGGRGRAGPAVLPELRDHRSRRRSPSSRRRRASASSGPSPATPTRSAAASRPASGGLLGRRTIEVDARKYIRIGGHRRAGRPDQGVQVRRGGPRHLLFRRQHGAARVPLPVLRGQPRGSSPTSSCASRSSTSWPRRSGFSAPCAGRSTAASEGPRSAATATTSSAPASRGRPMSATPCSASRSRGYRLIDGRASYGMGLQFFFLGYPIHFDWTKLTDLQVTTEGWKFDFWIGYDF